MENKYSGRSITFETLEKAVSGDYNAMQEVIRLFKPYMTKLSIAIPLIAAMHCRKTPYTQSGMWNIFQKWHRQGRGFCFGGMSEQARHSLQGVLRMRCWSRKYLYLSVLNRLIGEPEKMDGVKTQEVRNLFSTCMEL